MRSFPIFLIINVKSKIVDSKHSQSYKLIQQMQTHSPGTIEVCDQLYYQQIQEGRVSSPVVETPSTSVVKAEGFGGMVDNWNNMSATKQDKETDNIVNIPSIFTNTLKNIVSKNKKRFIWEAFDLDLAYITDNIIAMGFPSENIEAMYRNSLEQVQNFLTLRHHKHYKVYNLCMERKYSKDKFCGNFAQFPFQDHNSPPFELIFKCCKDMKQWLGKHKQNVAAIHCKAGKGRTGLIICCYLLYIGFSKNSEQCLKYYGQMRTHDGKGVTIKSQRRYIKYFEQAIKLNMTLQKYLSIKRRSKITFIKVTSAPQIHMFGGCTPWVHILSRSYEYKSKYTHSLQNYKAGEQFGLKIAHPFNLVDDFRLTFYSKGQIINKSSEFMRIWLNLKFISHNQTVLQIPAQEIDGVKSSDARFNMNMKVIITFVHLEGES